MNWATIVLIILGVIAIIIGLLISSSGATSGLNAMAGQDLELFKKTKDRGFVKAMQMVLFFIVFIIVVLLIVYKIVS